MINSPRFWVSMIVFQIMFGLVIFALTRQYYIQDPNIIRSDLSIIPQPADLSQNRVDKTTSQSLTNSATFNQFKDKYPVEISQKANQAFGNKQYSEAADLYKQLLGLDPDNANTHNNLGITLHYLGKSTEALQILNRGVAIDPMHQRSWLTLGFVNNQIGNIDQAQVALETAVKMNADNEIGKSAAKMLEGLL